MWQETIYLEWVLKRIAFINNNFADINTVMVFNNSKTIFGKKYYRIYFDIECEFIHMVENGNWKVNENFTTLGKEYIAFNSANNSESEVAINFGWICSLIWKLINDKSKLTISDFKEEINL